MTKNIGKDVCVSFSLVLAATAVLSMPAFAEEDNQAELNSACRKHPDQQSAEGQTACDCISSKSAGNKERQASLLEVLKSGKQPNQKDRAFVESCYS